MRRLLRSLLVALMVLSPTFVEAAATLYQTEDAAKQHCPADTVVWVNTATGVYHFRGQRWYGNTKQGAFVCQKEANAGGLRSTGNGQ